MEQIPESSKHNEDWYKAEYWKILVAKDLRIYPVRGAEYIDVYLERPPTPESFLTRVDRKKRFYELWLKLKDL
jgi:hypothetical protein